MSKINKVPSSHRRKVYRPGLVRGIKPWTPDETFDLLESVHGPIQLERRLDPTSELIWTILSQHTSDLNAGRAFDALVDAFDSWESVVQADTDQLASVIRHGGLARQKAPRIQGVLASIKERTGAYDISFLATLSLAQAKEWLVSLNGVGPKTAGVVLSFAIAMPAMAVDTHIFRVSKRLALIGPRVTANEAHDVLENSVKPERVLGLHVYLITHGRQVCKARKPLCASCALAAKCPSRQSLESNGDTRVPQTQLRHKPL